MGGTCSIDCSMGWLGGGQLWMYSTDRFIKLRHVLTMWECPVCVLAHQRGVSHVGGSRGYRQANGG